MDLLRSKFVEGLKKAAGANTDVIERPTYRSPDSKGVKYKTLWIKWSDKSFTSAEQASSTYVAFRLLPPYQPEASMPANSPKKSIAEIAATYGTWVSIYSIKKMIDALEGAIPYIKKQVGLTNTAGTAHVPIDVDDIDFKLPSGLTNKETEAILNKFSSELEKILKYLRMLEQTN